jgi:putative transposase
MHASIGYVTPDDEHEGRGDAIGQQRGDGLATARQARINHGTVICTRQRSRSRKHPQDPGSTP